MQNSYSVTEIFEKYVRAWNLSKRYIFHKYSKYNIKFYKYSKSSLEFSTLI